MNLATQTRSSVFALPAPGHRTRQGLLILAGSLVVAVSAHISVPLPWTPVPVTLSNLAVLLVGFALGPSAAAAALILYLLEGACGLPVFTPSGPGALTQLLHSSSTGYLLSYPAAAFLAGLLPKALRRLPELPVLALAGTAATSLVMLSGFLWLAYALHLGPASAFHVGVLPFLPGEVIKIVAAAGLGQALLRSRA